MNGKSDLLIIGIIGFIVASGYFFGRNYADREYITSKIQDHYRQFNAETLTVKAVKDQFAMEEIENSQSRGYNAKIDRLRIKSVGNALNQPSLQENKAYDKSDKASQLQYAIPFVPKQGVGYINEYGDGVAVEFQPVQTSKDNTAVSFQPKIHVAGSGGNEAVIFMPQDGAGSENEAVPYDPSNTVKSETTHPTTNDVSLYPNATGANPLMQ